jgi:hypothetical protein
MSESCSNTMTFETVDEQFEIASVWDGLPAPNPGDTPTAAARHNYLALLVRTVVRALHGRGEEPGVLERFRRCDQGPPPDEWTARLVVETLHPLCPSTGECTTRFNSLTYLAKEATR